MPALATYIVHFGPEQSVTVLAADKVSATRIACAAVAKATGTPGWTRIPRKVEVAA